jgi:hypothetical protein
MRFGWREAFLLCLVLATAALYFVRVPQDPPGFSIDESSICYNASTISQTGHDEYGVSWPLFFRAFGEYKNPTLIYLLAGLFYLTGPSVAVARLLVAALGVLAGLLLGLLAWKMTRHWITAILIGIAALLTPWLFESSRLVFEVAIYPALLAGFLIALWRASLKQKWNWSDVVILAMVLGLLTYSYSIGRLLAPLIALGLGLFINRVRWRSVAATWSLYGLLLIPLFIFHRQHPDALSGRFKALTYLGSGASLITKVKDFALHYLANVNPWRWLVTGEGNIRDHVQGTGSLLAASVVLAVLGLVIVVRKHRHDAWWRFLIYSLLVSPVPASLTSNPFPQLRLIAFPIFFLIFMIPAIHWLAELKTRLLLVAVVLLLLAQGIFFQWRYHTGAPSLWYVFDARFPRKVLVPALAPGQRPVILVDEPGKSGYIHPLWYGSLAGLDSRQFVRLSWGNPPPPGAIVISTEQDCQDCRVLARALNYIVYSVPPYPANVPVPRAELRSYQAEIFCENPPSSLTTGQTVSLRFLIKNTSSAEWPSVEIEDGSGAVVLQNRWRDSAGTIVKDRDAEQRVPYDVEPGDTVGLVLRVTPPDTPGDYSLEVDLVQKEVPWFSDRGSAAWKRKIKVAPKD